jgi:hypothetical protein
LAWLIFATIILIAGGVIGSHLGRFREAYTEMTGMMAGMTMGMLNGFLLGYAGAAAAASIFAGTVIGTATGSLFWGNLMGILLGALMGVYFGRAGGLMGMMDGGMGGVMGGSMGAMLAAMLTFPEGLLLWTAVLLGAVYVVGMAALVVLIEKSAPGHDALHWLAPYFTRAMAEEADEAQAALGGRQMPDYYDFLDVEWGASEAEITDAYIGKLADGDDTELQWAERALAILTDPRKRAAYDKQLKLSLGRGDCCPPPKRKQGVVDAATKLPATTITRTAATAVAVKPAKAPARVSREVKSQTKSQVQRVTQNRQARQTQHTKRRGLGAGPLIGAGLGGLLVVGLFLVWTLTQGSQVEGYTDNGNRLPDDFVAKLQTQAVEAPVSDGKQTLDLAVDAPSMSYKPSVIKVKKGVPVHFKLSAQNGDPGCGRYVGVRGLGVHGIVEPGNITSMDFTPDRTGIFQINCGMQMMDPGYLIVTQ